MSDAIGNINMRRSNATKDGRVKRKLILGVAINNGEYPSKINNKKLKQHRLWCDILKRCYDSEYLAKKPTYIGTKVCERWLDYANFYEDITKMEFFGADGYHLDKDILGDGKEYYPENCCFVPLEVNALFKRDDKGSKGVHEVSLGGEIVYTASITRGKCRAYLGTFWCFEDAKKAYNDAVKMYYQVLAIKYDGFVDRRVIEKLKELYNE